MPSITSRWPRWTPSNSPMAIRRGRGRASASNVTSIGGEEYSRGLAAVGCHPARSPTIGFRSPPSRGSATAISPSVVDQPHVARGAPRDRDAVGGTAGVVARQGDASGMNASASSSPSRRSAGVGDVEGADPGPAQRHAVGVPERGDQRCARRSPTSTRSHIRAGRSARHSSTKRCTVTSRSGSSTVSPARARAYARRPSTLIAEYAGGRWLTTPVGSGEIARRDPAGRRRSRPQGPRCSTPRRTGRRTRRPSVDPSETAATEWRDRRAAAAGRWRTGRGCRRGRPSRPGRASGAGAPRRRAR